MRSAEAGVDALFAELLRAGEDSERIRAVLARDEPADALLLAVLRRAIPRRFLDVLASSPPWTDRPRVLGAIVLNPRVPRALGLRLLPGLYWRDLAEVAASTRVQGGLRAGAESLLREKLPDLRLGERVALAKIATPPLLRALLADADPKVVRAALANPRLREEDLLLVVREAKTPLVVLEDAAASWRWRDQYAVRLALVLQPRTPLGVALAQVSGLLPRDLRRVASGAGLRPLLQAAAARVAEERARTGPGGGAAGAPGPAGRAPVD